MYHSIGVAPAAFAASLGAAVTAPAVLAGDPIPASFPMTGGGGMALATVHAEPRLVALAILFLAIWTLLMAGRALLSLRPKAEV